LDHQFQKDSQRGGEMKTIKIKSVQYLRENRPSKRELKIKLNNSTTVRASACHESWEQWGGTTEELYITMPFVEAHNDWLHGGSKPYFDED
jgi:hypothetical protein